MTEITLGQIAGLIAALGFLVLVYYLIKPLRGFAKLLNQSAESIRELTEHTLPIIDESAQTVAEAKNQMQKIDAITDAAARTSADISAMTTLVTSTIGAPFLAIRNTAQKLKRKFKKNRQNTAPSVANENNETN